ncbi:PDZ domain-containing protein [Nocardioides alcanivorans]|uniref:PDZ domain-containing protein n=1 Tax=Nocardioides alcanivorans TaxID=2897352 RepID=UPI001F366DFF
MRITADQILRDGEAQYPVIGAQVITDKSGQGVLIDEVTKGGAAEKGGLEKGDIVRRVDDRVVIDSPSLIVAIRAHVPGDEITLTVTRDGKELDVTLELDSKVG